MEISEKFVKKCFFTFNFAFVVTGIIFILTGIGAQNRYDKYSVFLDGRYYAQTTLFIICGFLTFLIAILGYIGSIKRNFCLMLTFTGMLSLLLILSLTAGIIGFVLRGISYQLISNNLNHSMETYLNGNKEVQTAWDTLQKEYKCCGVNNYKSWSEIIEKTFNVTELPLTCCDNFGKIGSTNCSYTIQNDNYDRYSSERRIDYKIVYSSGCVYRLISIMQDHSYGLAIVATTFVVIQAIGILLAYLAAREVKKQQNIKWTH